MLCFVSPDLIHCTNELNVSIPHLADTLLERTASNSWIVVFKALITTHHLMMYGNEVSWAHQHIEAQRGQRWLFFSNSQNDSEVVFHLDTGVQTFHLSAKISNWIQNRSDQISFYKMHVFFSLCHDNIDHNLIKHLSVGFILTWDWIMRQHICLAKINICYLMWLNSTIVTAVKLCRLRKGQMLSSLKMTRAELKLPGDSFSFICSGCEILL